MWRVASAHALNAEMDVGGWRVDEQTDSPKRLMRSPERHSPEAQNGSMRHSIEATNGPLRSPDRHSVGTQNGTLGSPEMRVLDIQNGAARNIDRNSTDSQTVVMSGSKKSSSQNSSSGHTSRRKFLRRLFKRRRSSTREKDIGRALSPRAAHSQPDIRMCSPTYSHQYVPSYSPQCTPTYSPQHTPSHTPLPDLRSLDIPQVHELSESPPGRSFCGMTTCGGSVQSLDAIADFSSDIPVISASEVTGLRRRRASLQGHPFYCLEVVLKEGRDLVIKDNCGTSDPYVKFKMAGKQCYKSRIVYKNLNPKWDEKFCLPIEDPYVLIHVKVFDYDRCLTDDHMGSAILDPSTLHLDTPTQVRLDLSEKGQTGNMGYLLLECTLMPRSQDDKDMFQLTTKVTEAAKKLRTHPRGSIVTLVLVRGTDLLPMDDNGLSDPYVKFRLGNEKYKSKYKPKTLNPVWLEQFNLHMFDDKTSHLEISVWDHDAAGKDDIMGRAIVNLSTLRKEATHCLEQQLEDGAGSIKLLLTISAVSGTDVLDMTTYSLTPLQRQSIVREYGLLNSFKDRYNVGWLQIKVIKAEGLASADIGGKSDPFCVLELDNARLQTCTEYKTLNPEWGKVFVMQVKDVHSVLEVTVFDEDRDRKAEFLGKVVIPLLKVRNMERKWFMLKDRKLLVRAKGAILLEMDLIYNPGKAFIRTFTPREEIYMQPEPKFRIALMKRNIERVSNIIQAVVETGRFVRSCFDWESPPRSITAFIVYLVMVWNFELYMLPVTLLTIFLKNLLLQQITGSLMRDKLHELDDAEEEDCDDDDDDDDDERDKLPKQLQILLTAESIMQGVIQDGKKSFKERLQGIQDVCLQVQEGMDALASLGERIKNTFNWTVPWLSWLMVVLLAVISVILYWLPLRYLMLIWGINKFTKKLRAPNAIANNELLDFLSRLPSDVELAQYRVLRPDSSLGAMKKKRS